MHSLTFWTVSGWLSLHLFGLIVAWVTRIASSPRAMSASQIAFFFALAAVGIAAWSSHHFAPNLWVVSSIVLVSMVLTAVVDFRRTSESAPSHSPGAYR
jgi:hypothetical protein